MENMDLGRINLQGLRCPIPILRIKRMLKNNSDLKNLEVITDHLDVVKDIYLFCQKNEYGCVDQRINDTVFLIVIKI